ncbi:MAG: hypothetical protein N2645_20275 [Clostridia bacterium]|nr:hypothetical protein [Clostridia bacterium]
MFERYDDYTEKLLLAQYNVSEMVEHKLMRGEIREDFLKLQIENRYRDIQCCKGAIVDVNGQNQSGQIDLVIAKQCAQVRRMGGHSIISVDDAVFIIEVKSNAKGTEFTSLNDKAMQYKAMEGGHSVLVGMFCYYYELKMKSLLRRFGYVYDEDLQAFQQQPDINPPYSGIDFVVCLDDDIDDDTGSFKRFFIMRDETNDRFVLYQENPVSKHFFKLLGRGLR